MKGSLFINMKKNKNIKNNNNHIKKITKRIEEGKYQEKNNNNSPTLDSFIKNGGIITDNEYEVTSNIEEIKKEVN